MKKYLVKTIVGRNDEQLDLLFETHLNEHCEHYELWEYEYVSPFKINVVMRAIEVQHTTNPFPASFGGVDGR